MLDLSAAGEVSLLAPDLILIELASLISKQHRRKRISAADAQKSLDLPTRIAPFAGRNTTSLEYGASLCVYIVLAIECECPCLTADRRLLRSPIGKHAQLRLRE